MTYPYSVVLKFDNELLVDINVWCMRHFGQPALRWEPVSSQYKWSDRHRMDTIRYEFFNEDDATLFKLTWT